MGNIQAVDNLSQGTAEVGEAKRQELLAKRAALMAELAKLNKEMPDLTKEVQEKADELKYQAFRVNMLRKPFDDEYDRISNEYTDLVGSEGTNPNGTRKLRKIVIRESEEADSLYQKFLARFRSEQKREQHKK